MKKKGGYFRKKKFEKGISLFLKDVFLFLKNSSIYILYFSFLKKTKLRERFFLKKIYILGEEITS